MTKRAKILTALIAAVVLVLVSPLAATAYWVVSAQLAVTARTSTFSVAPFALAAAPTGTSSSFTGPTGTRYFAAPLVNDGATAWAGRSVTVDAASDFGAGAIATVQVAFAAAASACQTDATYASVAPQSALASSTWNSTAAVAAGATIVACAKVVVTDTATKTPSGQPAPAPSLTLTVTGKASLHGWSDQEQAAVTLSSTGWAACTTGSGTVTLTFPAAVQPGRYTIQRADTGATFSANVQGNARTTITFANPATSGTEDAATYVTVTNSSAAVVAMARVSFRSSGSGSSFTETVACA